MHRSFLLSLTLAGLTQLAIAQSAPESVIVTIESVDSGKQPYGLNLSATIDGRPQAWSMRASFDQIAVLRRRFHIAPSQSVATLAGSTFEVPLSWALQPTFSITGFVRFANTCLSWPVSQELSRNAYVPPKPEVIYERIAKSLAAQAQPSFIDIDAQSLDKALGKIMDEGQVVTDEWADWLTKRVGVLSAGAVKVSRFPGFRSSAWFVLRSGNVHFQFTIKRSYTETPVEFVYGEE